MVGRSEAVNALLALEDDAPEALWARLPDSGLYVWPFLRWPLAQRAASREMGSDTLARDTRRVTRLARLARNALPVSRRARAASGPTDVLFMVGGSTVVRDRDRTTNWLVDPLARAAGSATIVQDLRLTGVPSFARTYTLADSLARVDAATRVRPLSPRDAEVAAAASRDLVPRLARDGIDTEAMSRQTVYRMGRAVHLEAEVDRLLDRLRPSVVVVEEAAYLGRGHLVRRMRERGIRVAEPQHGVLGPSHAAYNHGAAMRQPGLLEHLPHELLTFGEFWGEGLAWPTALVPIGKPSLSESAAAVPPVAERPPAVLVVSSMLHTDRLIDTARRVRDLLPGEWEVVLRPHPAERSTADRIYGALIAEPRIRLDLGGDVHRTFGAVRATFGFISTVSYEALAFGLPSFVLDSTSADLYMPQTLFGDRIRDDGDLTAAVARVVAGDPLEPLTLDRVWHPDPGTAFRTYLSEVTR